MLSSELFVGSTKMTFFLPFSPIFLITCPQIPFFLHRSFHHIDPHVMLVFEPNWLDGYRVINFFSSPTAYFSMGFH